MFITYFFVAACAYLIGSLNFGVIVSRLFLGKDIRQHGSGNAGATNAFRVMGPKLATLVMLGDIGKGVGAALLGRHFAGANGTLTAFVFVVLGHVFPLYFGFRGGKGVLTTAAVLLIFDWRMFVILVGVFVVAVSCTRYVSLGSILGAVLLPVVMLIFHPVPLWNPLVALLIGAAVVFLHRGNIRRLFAGTESKFSFRAKS